MLFKKWIILVGSLSLASVALATQPADLMAVYKEAIQNDPIFKEAYAQRQIVEETVPTAWSALLPQITGTGAAGYARTRESGNGSTAPTTGSEGRVESTSLALSLTQQVFNMADFVAVAAANNGVKSAYATYSSAEQSLMQRTAETYFAVLSARDSLIYAQAQERAFYQQYIQAKDSFEVGVKTITDVDNAKASYDSSVAQRITAENNLADARENLRALTGTYYPELLSLKTLPDVKLVPADINGWSDQALENNWALKAAHFSALQAHNNIEEARAGHLPTVDLTGSSSNAYNRTMSPPQGNLRTKEDSATLNLTVPIYSGGAITDSVKTAIAQYNLANATFDQTYRDTINQTRQAYLGVQSGISVIQADYQSIVSNVSSLEGMKEGYEVGTRTIVDVLNAETSLYQAYQQYATDRYNYINNLINLKYYAGTLNANDLVAINQWLGEAQPLLLPEKSTPPPRRIVPAPIKMPKKLVK